MNADEFWNILKNINDEPDASVRYRRYSKLLKTYKTKVKDERVLKFLDFWVRISKWQIRPDDPVYQAAQLEVTKEMLLWLQQNDSGIISGRKEFTEFKLKAIEGLNMIDNKIRIKAKLSLR